ncbi:MAG: hypothetical protein ACI9FN_004026 [Saprospiraceae bacterium]|jgi:hypothetical protein
MISFGIHNVFEIKLTIPPGSSLIGGSFDTDYSFLNAITYTPTTAGIDGDFVLSTLTSDDPIGVCPARSDSVRIEILDIRCSDFP